MSKRLGVTEAMERVARRLQTENGDRPLPRKLIVEQVVAECGCGDDSALPSDHCYNRINNGIKLENTPMFLHEGKGLYRFVGLGFRYTGPLMHHPKRGKPRQVGHWVDGVLTYSG